MNTAKPFRGLVLATTAAALFASTGFAAAADEMAAGTDANDKAPCYGVNSCKALSDCKGENGCKGKNSCNGKGFLNLGQDDCDVANVELLIQGDAVSATPPTPGP